MVDMSFSEIAQLDFVTRYNSNTTPTNYTDLATVYATDDKCILWIVNTTNNGYYTTMYLGAIVSYEFIFDLSTYVTSIYDYESISITNPSFQISITMLDSINNKVDTTITCSNNVHNSSNVYTTISLDGSTISVGSNYCLVYGSGIVANNIGTTYDGTIYVTDIALTMTTPSKLTITELRGIK